MCDRRLILSLLATFLEHADASEQKSIIGGEVPTHRPDGEPLTAGEREKIRRTLLTVKEYSPGQTPVLPEHIAYGPGGHERLVPRGTLVG